MAIWEKPGYEDAILMGRLQRLAEGFDSQGNPVSVEVQMQAAAQFQEIVRQKQLAKNDTMRAHGDYMRAENDRMRAENDRLRAETERLEALARIQAIHTQRKLSVVETTERLQIEKARVVVQALEVAVRGGSDPQAVLGTVQDLMHALTTQGEEKRKELTADVDEQPKQLPGPVDQPPPVDNRPYWEKRRNRQRKD